MTHCCRACSVAMHQAFLSDSAAADAAADTVRYMGNLRTAHLDEDGVRDPLVVGQVLHAMAQHCPLLNDVLYRGELLTADSLVTTGLVAVLTQCQLRSFRISCSEVVFPLADLPPALVTALADCTGSLNCFALAGDRLTDDQVIAIVRSRLGTSKH